MLVPEDYGVGVFAPRVDIDEPVVFVFDDPIRFHRAAVVPDEFSGARGVKRLRQIHLRLGHLPLRLGRDRLGLTDQVLNKHLALLSELVATPRIGRFDVAVPLQFEDR